jgi:alanine racemase
MIKSIALQYCFAESGAVAVGYEAFPEPLWAEIDLCALRHNFSAVRSHVGKGVRIMAVVKADAYGHGAVAVAHELLRQGADAFGVARLDEAVELRENGITRPVLIFGPTPPQKAPLLAHYGIIQTVHSDTYAEALQAALLAQQPRRRVQVHIKVDTGMGRLGYIATGNGGDVPLGQVFAGFSSRTMLDVCGVFTHFAASDAADPVTARRQLAVFEQALSELPAGVRDRLCVHAANSAATMVMPDARFDMVRPGIILYGLRPSAEMDTAGFDLRPVMSLKGRIASVKRVPAGFTVSYGHTHVTAAGTVIAAVPAGYADGYSRLLSSCGTMLVHGRPAAVTGRVCMDQTMIDVGHIDGVQEGDEVVLLGRQGAESVTADDHARLTSTINYEVVSRILARVPRVYVENAE